MPGSGRPTPDNGFWVRLAVAVVVVGLVATYVLMRDDDGPTTTTAPRTTPSTTNTPSETTATTAAETSPSPSATSSSATPSPTSAAPSPTPTAGKRPPTLALRVLRPSYITVRIPGGRTLVSRLFRAGERRSFDQKILQVVNGRPSAVRFKVNGELRKPGPPTEPETFTVRRR